MPEFNSTRNVEEDDVRVRLQDQIAQLGNYQTPIFRSFSAPETRPFFSQHILSSLNQTRSEDWDFRTVAHEYITQENFNFSQNEDPDLSSDISEGEIQDIINHIVDNVFELDSNNSETQDN